MQELLSTIEELGCSKLGLVLHLGAGWCRELEGYLRFNPDKVVLVEANAELAAELKIRARGLRQLEVVAAAVAEAEGEVTLRLLNNPRESSLLLPGALLNHYPNLVVTRDISVPAVTLAQLIERSVPDVSSDNLLVLEIQGAEVSVLSSVSADVLQKFSWIAVRASNEELYEGGGRLKDVEATLRAFGFRTVHHELFEAALPFQDVLHRRDAELIRLQALSKQLHEHERTIEALRQSLDEQLSRTAQLEGEKTSLSQRLAALEAELATAGRAHEEQARLAEERRGELERLVRERDEQVKAVKEQQAKIIALESESESLARSGESLKAELVTTRKTQEEQAQLAEERGNVIERLARERDERMRLMDAQQAQLEALIRSREEQADNSAKLQLQIEKVTKERDENRNWHLENKKWAENLKQQNDALQRERDEHVRLMGDLQKQIEELTRSREERVKDLTASQHKITEMEQARSELEHRQRLLDEEMVKAEAQIELIKDVLLREKAF